jgi:D-alanyl-D-alanine carboxypeptidase/D-alanyl-D-alanine-endopeptidase (penicillin-binding protein 4)
VSALQYNENVVRVTVAPGGAVGDWASVSAVPAASGLAIDSALTTTPAGTPANIAVRRLPGSSRLELRGSLPLGSPPATRAVSVGNPTLFFATALRDALIAQGIDVRGPAVDVDDIPDAPAREGAAEIISYRSAPLSELAIRLMKVSQNLYAETFLKTLGMSSGTATFAAGRAAAQAALEPWGIHGGDLIERDGSGLSRYDFVSPSALVTILTHVHGNQTLRGPFEAALPIAGRDGTLANRMKDTPAEGNARAKTGSMANVRTLSGFVTTADGEPLVFSILANNFETSPDVIIRTIDAIVVRLATFTRLPATDD